MPAPGDFVFDDGPLSHFAEAGWLGLLELLVGEAHAYIPDVVAGELREGAVSYTHLQAVLDAPWLRPSTFETTEEWAYFASYSERLVGRDGRKNVGECGVLATCRATGSIAVIDDGVARSIASEDGVSYVTTVGLLCVAVREHGLSLNSASTVADHLLRTEYRLPFEPGGFKQFVRENDLLPYE